MCATDETTDFQRRPILFVHHDEGTNSKVSAEMPLNFKSNVPRIKVCEKAFAGSENRTLDLRIMRPTRCRLR